MELNGIKLRGSFFLEIEIKIEIEAGNGDGGCLSRGVEGGGICMYLM